MVQSQHTTLNKATSDGDKVRTTSYNVSSSNNTCGGSGNNKQTTRTTTTTTQPFSSGGSSNTTDRLNEQQIVRSGSGGSECLFNRSNEELLDLDLDLELRSDLNKQTANYHNNNNNFHNNNSSSNFHNSFSIDSREQKSNYHQQQFYSPFNKESCCNRLCCFGCWWPNQSYQRSILRDDENSNWSKQFSKWRFDLPIHFDRIKRMAMRRYYLILFCLILIIVSCLIASLVISRSVGDLDGDSSTSNDGQSSRLQSGLNSNSNYEDELEPRTIDLVDLIECGKTFAYTKYRIQVKVPKSSPVFNQKPSFLFINDFNNNKLDNDEETNSLVINSNDPIQKSSSDNKKNQFELSSSSNLKDDVLLNENEKYYLTTMKETTSIQTEQDKQAINDDSSYSSTSLHNNIKKNNEQSQTTLNPLNLDIKPVTGAKSDAATPGIEDLAALLAMTTTGEKRTEGLGPVTTDNDKLSDKYINSGNNKSLDKDQIDPLELAASGLHFSLNSISNRTMLDCFLVDTEKRYDQKIAIEDNYRQLASTRKISFKKMMTTIIDCRKLTWASLPNTIKIKSIPGEQPLVATASTSIPSVNEASNMITPSTTTSQSPTTYTNLPSQIGPTTTLSISSSRDKESDSIVSVTISPVKKPTHDFIGTLLSNWFHYGPSNNGANSLTSSAKQLTQSTDTVDGSSSQEQLTSTKQTQQLGFTESPSTTLLSQESQNQILKQQQQQLQSQKKQASFLNMGISMVNGIIPNTLWCGLGDRAANYSELGAEYKVDACCRAHDHCPIRLKPFTTDYGLVNWSMSTRSHCECDIDFNECLNGVNSTLSNVIKVLYFRFVGLQCIDVESRTASTTINGLTVTNPLTVGTTTTIPAS